jgi:exosortase J
MSSSKGLSVASADESIAVPPAPGMTAPEPETGRSSAAPLAIWCIIAFLAALGCLGLQHEISTLWVIWTTDPLRSIGMLIPLASIVLTLRVWRQTGWEMRGTWWGLMVIGLSFFLSILRQKMMLSGLFGNMSVSFIPIVLPVYLYGSGIVLLFAGTRVWRRAWFPLGLLLLSQPVPNLVNPLIDLPLQAISAQVARSFATLIGFAPTTPQLHLMFAPNFGMFIAPGCDGIRGAVTLGYGALIIGYLKRVSLRRWAAYVIGAVLLAYFFNFTRLCVLVLYYRVAIGHPGLEGVAKQADYVIGSCLFLVAVLLFLGMVRRKEGDATAEGNAHVSEEFTAGFMPRAQRLWLKCAAFALMVLVTLSLPVSSLRKIGKASTTPVSFAERMPKRVGNFALTRTWYEQQGGTIVLQAGAYSAPGSDEIILGVWVSPSFQVHDANVCWLARGQRPDLLTSKSFVTARGNSDEINTGFYNDGITDSIVLNAYCTPASCSQFQHAASGGHFGFLFMRPQLGQLAGAEGHPVSFMIRIDKLHTDVPKNATYDNLTSEARSFMTGLDPNALSRAFQ